MFFAGLFDQLDGFAESAHVQHSEKLDTVAQTSFDADLAEQRDPAEAIFQRTAGDRRKPAGSLIRSLPKTGEGRAVCMYGSAFLRNGTYCIVSCTMSGRAS